MTTPVCAMPGSASLSGAERESTAKSFQVNSCLETRSLRLETLSAKAAVKNAGLKDLSQCIRAQRLLALSLCLCTHMWRTSAQLSDPWLRVVAAWAWLREEKVLPRHPQLHAGLDEIHRVVQGIPIEVS